MYHLDVNNMVREDNFLSKVWFCHWKQGNMYILSNTIVAVNSARCGSF